VTVSDGVQVNLTNLGGSGPTLLLVHGASLCGSMFGPLATALDGRFASVALDLRGHGHSSRPSDHNYAWGRLADDVAQVLDALDGPIYGFGHSLGATALLVAAARRPGKLSALCTFEPVLLDSPLANDLARAQATRSERRYAEFSSLEVARDRLFSKPPLDHLVTGAIEAYLRDGFDQGSDGTMRLVLAPSDESEIYRAGIGANLDAELSNLEVPVTVLAGTAGHNAAVVTAELVHTLIPQAAFVEIDRVSHFAPFERPDLIAQAVITAFDTADA
jgi:pimeloyl-ACP methyl ester carboxylesterase